ncbi:MAG: peptidoglycan-binding protein [Planctomycetia bacterium]|nr:peptidoglycan-binding protein [Planctomycetia bacterium]
MPLTSPRFAGNQRLQEAARNAPPLSGRDCGTPVRLVQQALMDLGYSMPISNKKHGSPDGIYGQETKKTVHSFQQKYHLQIDGITGKQVMTKLDELLPTAGKPLPPTPSLVPYRVPGLISPLQQPSGMACWATSYTMMVSWRRQQSLAIRDAVSDLGQKWLNYYDANTGTSPYDNIEFARTAGLQYEPLQSFSIDGWALLLRRHGLLWLSFAWQVAGLNGLPTRRGRHIIIIYGLTGDGSPDGTKVLYIDPGDGQFHSEPFMTFLADYELGFTIDPNMSDSQMSGFSQIIHY